MSHSFHEQFKMMTAEQKKAAKGVAVIICVAVLFVIGYGLNFLRFDVSSLSRTTTDLTHQEDIKKMTARSAFDIAFARAKEWRADAQLSLLSAQTPSDAGHSDSWRLIFVSQQEKDKGFVITINNKVIISVEETSYRGAAADFPANILSTDEAIKRVHEIRGYADVPILGIEAIYGPAEKAWYWGIRTPKGVVTIEAKRN